MNPDPIALAMIIAAFMLLGIAIFSR